MGGGGDGTLIRMYRFADGEVETEDVASLPGHMCRFLNVGDTTGDGQPELFASTKEDGIHRIVRTEDGWETKVVVPSYLSSGFEHATVVTDLDGDGVDELVVAADDQKRAYVWRYDPERDRYDSEVIWSQDQGLSITWGVMPFPSSR